MSTAPRLNAFLHDLHASVHQGNPHSHADLHWAQAALRLAAKFAEAHGVEAVNLFNHGDDGRAMAGVMAVHLIWHPLKPERHQGPVLFFAVGDYQQNPEWRTAFDAAKEEFVGLSARIPPANIRTSTVSRPIFFETRGPCYTLRTVLAEPLPAPAG
jgi:hypothetical protein